jgi:hypothetical protein
VAKVSQEAAGGEESVDLLASEENMKSLRIGMILALVTAASACGKITWGGGHSQDRIYDITTNQDTYDRGNVGEATIRNASDASVEYNLCPRRLERRVSSRWITSFEWPTAGGVCTGEARTLRRGDSVNTLFDIPTGVPAGTYRVVFTGLRNPEGSSLPADISATSSFSVR